MKTPTVPAIATVYIARNRDSRDLEVITEWAGVDRARGVAFAIPSDKMDLANRLVLAIKSGVIFSDPRVAVDIHGKTYVTHGTTVMGRTLNSDLERLGF